MSDFSVNELPLGEVVEASTAYFRAQCPRSLLHEPPELGALVKITPRGASAAVAAFPSAAPPEPDPFADPPSRPAPVLPSEPDGVIYAVVCLAATGPG